MPYSADRKQDKILVTGATGFIGQHLVSTLANAGICVAVLTRPVSAQRVAQHRPGKDISTISADLLDHSSLVGVCNGASTVFHLAGYAHVDDADRGRSDETHWRITVDGTRALLREAAFSKVKNFIFVSTVKAMGEGGESCLDEASPLEPLSGYGVAKRVAEQLVLEAGKKHDMHVCVLRFPMVYGPYNKGNLPRMIAAIDRGRFPPLPPLGNRRSMLHVDDAVQALLLAAAQPRAGGQVYVVTDGVVYSTDDIYLKIRAALGMRRPRWHIPIWLLRAGGRFGDLVGRFRRRPFMFDSNVLAKLAESAWYSNKKITRELGYRPTRTLADGLPEMIEEYRRHKQ